MNLEEKLKYLFSQNPKLHESNTETCIRLWEYVAEARGTAFTWIEMKQIIREYHPETITRARRKLVEPTKKQREKEEEMHNIYSKSNPSKY